MRRSLLPGRSTAAPWQNSRAQWLRSASFFIAELLAYLEEHLLPYAIAVRMDPRIKRAVAGLRQWTAFAPGLAAAETGYQALGWKAARRLVVVREELRERPEARGRPASLNGPAAGVGWSSFPDMKSRFETPTCPTMSWLSSTIP